MMPLLHLARRAAGLVVLALRGGVAYARYEGVRVGEGCRIYARSWGTEPFLIEIGNRVTITSGVTILTHDGATWLIRDDKGRRYRYAPVRIGDDVFIGVNSTILPGVTIGNRVIVGAGSVVTRPVADGSIVAGVPARVVGSYESFHARALGALPSDADLVGAGSYADRVSAALRIAAQRDRPRSEASEGP